MAWSSYAHLPNKEDEYWLILSDLQDGMTLSEVDNVIAKVKGKQKVQHHYRRNLANLGLFDILDDKRINLNYDVFKLIRDRSYLKDILAECVYTCEGKEIQVLKSIISVEKTYDLEEIVNCLILENPDIEKKNYVRWVRPIVNLFKIIDFLNLMYLDSTEKEDTTIWFLQKAYLNLVDDFGQIVVLEDMDRELRKIDSSYRIVYFIENLISNPAFKFKIELLMMPNWATKSKVYNINGEYYTHFKIKANLAQEEEA